MKCPAGHESTELDYCGVCGAPMAGAQAAPAAIAATAGASSCPQCGEPRAIADARFCEVCRYDFVKGTPPARTSAGPSARATPTPKAPAGAAAVAAKSARWELTLTVDPTLDTEPDPSLPPPNDPVRRFPIEVAEMLVGRRDDAQNIRPAVPLNDPGASRRHAKFLLNADGSVSLQDLASMNGTHLNGKAVLSGSLQVLHEGDEVTLGRWTRIALRARS